MHVLSKSWQEVVNQNGNCLLKRVVKIFETSDVVETVTYVTNTFSNFETEISSKNPRPRV